MSSWPREVKEIPCYFEQVYDECFERDYGFYRPVISDVVNPFSNDDRDHDGNGPAGHACDPSNPGTVGGACGNAACRASSADACDRSVANRVWNASNDASDSDPNGNNSHDGSNNPGNLAPGTVPGRNQTPGWHRDRGNGNGSRGQGHVAEVHDNNDHHGPRPYRPRSSAKYRPPAHRPLNAWKKSSPYLCIVVCLLDQHFYHSEQIPQIFLQMDYFHLKIVSQSSL